MTSSIVYTATLVKQLSRYQTCEKCQCQYTFSATGFGRGQARAMAFTDARKTASDLAISRANESATSALAACPDCGWYNTSAIRIYQQQRFRMWQGLVWSITGGALFVGWMVSGGSSSRVTTAFLAIAAVAIAAACGILWLLKSTGSRYNPNAGWPEGRMPLGGNPRSSRTPEYQAEMDAWRAQAAGMQWYYINDAHRGPVTYAQLQQLLRMYQIKMTDLVWAQGLAEWVPAITVVK